MPKTDSNSRIKGNLTLILSAGARQSSCSSVLRRLERELLLAEKVELVLSAESLERMLVTCRQLAPCVLLVDAQELESVQGGALSSFSEYGSAVRVLVLVEEGSPAAEMRYVRMGCSGCLPRSSSLSTVRRAIAAVAHGEIWGSRFAISQLLRFCLQSESAQLTERERVILNLISQGYKNNDIARFLYISSETVRWHLRRLYRKLGTHDRRRVSHLAEALTANDTAPPPPRRGDGGLCIVGMGCK
jgi:DNA-binding NarL/FixJ family response regulator